MAYIVDGKVADAEAVRAAAKAAESARNAATRARNGTAAKERRGKHRALTAEQKAARASQREADRKRRSSERADKQAEREVAINDNRDRAALLRLILREQRQEELEADRVRRQPIVVKVVKEPRVTAAGGRRLCRRFELLTGGASASSPASRAATDGLYSIVVRMTPRGFREAGPKRWRRNEAANLVRYLTRLDALEREAVLCILSNLVGSSGRDATGLVIEPGTDEWARQQFALWQSIEQLEADAAGVIPGKQTANVNVYRHIIIPLPDGLDADGRLELVREITDPFRARDLPFVASLHRPDAGGDQRNFHVHIIVSARRCVQVAPYHWEFEPLKDADVFSPEYLLAFRAHVADAFNAALVQAGSERVYTHLSREQRNVEPVADIHEGRGRTISQRKADHLTEVTRRLKEARASFALLDALERVGKELATVLRSSAELADSVVAEVRHGIGFARELLANPTNVSLGAAATIVKSAVNLAATAGEPLSTVEELAHTVAAVPLLPAEHRDHTSVTSPAAPAVGREELLSGHATPATAAQLARAADNPSPASGTDGALPEIQLEASPTRSGVERQPLNSAGAENHDREIVALQVGSEPADVKRGLAPESQQLTPAQHARAIADSMGFAADEMLPVGSLIDVLRNQRLEITADATVPGGTSVSAHDLAGAYAVSIVAQTKLGRAFLSRMATEVAQGERSIEPSARYVLQVQPSRVSWEGEAASRLLPAAFRSWPSLYSDARVALDAVVAELVAPNSSFGVGLDKGTWWYACGNGRLESAALMLRADFEGVTPLKDLAAASQTSFGSLSPIVPVWRSDRPGEAPRPMPAEIAEARNGPAQTQSSVSVVQKRPGPAAPVLVDPYIEATSRLHRALIEQPPRARVFAVGGRLEVLVRDAALADDLAVVAARTAGQGFLRQRAREVHEVPIGKDWIRWRAPESREAADAHAEMLRRIREQGGRGR